MKLLKPSWVHHDEKPIFSVDVHQGCLKFATGGQGLDSGRVVIWNLLPVLSEKAEQDESVPKMLCQMDNHLACVNCVRWSQNGLMLASASDDKLIMIWRKAVGSSGVFGTGGIQKNPESWKCFTTLRGHAGDVLDLAWSPQDRWLASCSIDNTIIVWEAQAFPSILAVLKGHTGLVKGVAWDPVGKFLASQSDDRSVKIWKTNDWTCSSTITEPFEECGGTTHILRLSWSPDGQYLVSAHAMNGGGPTAQIIEREGWKCDKDFVGHRKAVTCVRFHTSILKRQAPKTNKAQQYCCLAVGSRDRSLSVWMTALQRPLVVIHELFNDSILDLSWGPEKCILMACSGDGTVACLQFDEQELGTPLAEEDKNTLYQRMYGKSATMENGNNGCDILIENPELLYVTQEKPKPPDFFEGEHNQNFIETPSLPPNGFSSISTMPIQTSTLSPPNTSASLDVSMNSTTTVNKPISKQTETRTADGKRRITPVFIPLNQDMSNTTSQLSSSSRPISTITETVAATPVAPVSNVDKESSAATPAAAKPIITEVEDARLDSRLIKVADRSQLPHVDGSEVKSFPTVFTKKPTTQGTPPAANATTWTGTPYQASSFAPKMDITQASKCEFYKAIRTARIHVQNGNVTTAAGLLCKVTAYCVNVGGKLWDTFVGSPVINCNLCSKYAILCSLDGTLRIYDMPTGSTVLPIISLTTASVQCAFCPHGKYVGVITECGLLRIWDIEKACAILATTCAEVFSKFGQIMQFTITEHGMPFVIFASGNSYTYSPQMQSWLVLNTKDPVFRYGLRTSMPREFKKNFHAYPLLTVQGNVQNYAASMNDIDIDPSEWQTVAKILFLENQIKLCEAVKSEDELKYWYSMLVYQLAVNGNERRLRVVLDDLLGPAHGYTPREVVEEERKILSISKLSLFERALNILKSQAKWQRIYMEYKDLYENIKYSSSSKSSSSSTPAEHTTQEDEKMNSV